MQKEFLFKVAKWPHKTPLIWPFPLITLQWKYLKCKKHLIFFTKLLNYSVGVPHLYNSAPVEILLHYFRKKYIFQVLYYCNVLRGKWSNQGCLVGSLIHLQLKILFAWCLLRVLMAIPKWCQPIRGVGGSYKTERGIYIQKGQIQLTICLPNFEA